MEAFGVAVRWLHFLGASLLVGVFACLVLVGRPAARAAEQDAQRLLAPLDRRLVALGTWALFLTFGSGLLDLWRQTTVATGLGLRESLAPAAVGPVLLRTQYGTVWLVRHALLVLLAGLVFLRDEERDAKDWLALRLEGLGLAAGGLATIGAAGHAASAQQFPAAAIGVDAAHLLATGVWFGALVPLAILLHWALQLPDRTGIVVAAAATRRFSLIGFASVTLLVSTGLFNAWAQAASFAALLGTPYGRWLLLKLGLMLPLVVTAAVNHCHLKPRLVRAATREPGDPGRATIRQLRRNVLVEVLLGCAILGVVAVLGLTTPARHSQVTWPFSFRFAWDAVRGVPGVQTRVAIGSQIAVLGLVAVLLAAIVRRRHWRWILGAGAAGVAAGLTIALPPLAVDAYPTTYRRPAVPYAASSIASGLTLYRTHCAVCHGVAGYGDGPAAASLHPKPADLTAKHTGDHTAGDLFWWLTHGIRRSAMPGFGNRLSEEERWDLINFLRALASAEEARGLGPVVEPTPTLVAPDFAFTTGPEEGRALKDARGRVVLLVLFRLPDSAGRLRQLATVYPALRGLGAEVLGIPVGLGRNAYRALGDLPVFFPIAVDGADEAATAYGLFRRDFSPEGQQPEPPPARHMELLVDRQGYLRARWILAEGVGWADPTRLVATVEQLAQEPPRAVAPEEHVH